MNKKFGLILEKWAEKAKVRVSWEGNKRIFSKKEGFDVEEIKSERFRGLFLGPFGLKSEEKLE